MPGETLTSLHECGCNVDIEKAYCPRLPFHELLAYIQDILRERSDCGGSIQFLEQTMWFISEHKIYPALILERRDSQTGRGQTIPINNSLVGALPVNPRAGVT